MYLPFRGSQTTIWLLGSKPIDIVSISCNQGAKDPRTLEGKILHAMALVGVAVFGHNGSVRDQRVMDTRERNQVGLELIQVDVESTIETQTGGDGAHNLGDEAVQLVVTRALNAQVSSADIIDSLVINEERAVGVFDGAVSGQNGIVRLHDGVRHARGRVDGEFQLGLLAILGGNSLEQKGTESRSGSTAEGMEDHKALQGRAVVCITG